MTYVGGNGGRKTGVSKARHTSFNIVNASSLGAKGGTNGFGKSKVRGNKAYYSALAKARWAKKKGIV